MLAPYFNTRHGRRAKRPPPSIPRHGRRDGDGDVGSSDQLNSEGAHAERVRSHRCARERTAAAALVRRRIAVPLAPFSIASAPAVPCAAAMCCVGGFRAKGCACQTSPAAGPGLRASRSATASSSSRRRVTWPPRSRPPQGESVTVRTRPTHSARPVQVDTVDTITGYEAGNQYIV